MNNKGFSLIELLVVILVLAVLTGIAIPVYGLMITRAKESATESEVVNIAEALEIYNSDNQAYPLPDQYPDGLEENKYMTKVPLVDAWERGYVYDSDGTSYRLTSPGMDGISGNSDDIAISNGEFTAFGAYGN